jgi:polyhydroxyalkanoate synthesis regulator phasin
MFMRRKLSVFVLCFFALLLAAGTAIAAEIKDPILKKLVEKGILTQEEAISVMQDMEGETVKEEKKVDEKIEKKVSENMPADTKDINKVVQALKGWKFGYLWYISYQNGEAGDTSGGEGFSRFTVKRGYINIEKEITPWFSARVTPDVSQMTDNGSFDGSFTVRLKYLYGKFKLPEFAFLTKPFVEVGIVHMPWLDYEENLNWYRCQDTMFLERNGLFNSADVGINFVSLFGGLISEEYQNKVNNAYPGRYGSMALAVMNGGGYTAAEKNQNKVLEGRLTIRPLPDIIPGLQFSYFGITGKGNKGKNDIPSNPTWQLNNGFVSFEHEYVVLTGQYYWGKGNQSGADTNKRDGYSFFAELKPHKKFSIIGRYDFFDPNDDQQDDESRRYIAGVAYHLDKQHKNMILLDYDSVDYKQSEKSNDKRVQLTLQVSL